MLKYKSGVNQIACMSTAYTTTGAYTFNSNGCTAIGTGIYTLNCFTGTEAASTKTSNDITITVLDICQSPIVFTSVAYTTLTY